MPNIKGNSAALATQGRLLLAAGEVFAERGYRAATIKEITDRAGASLASVNYHFGGKEELYRRVIRRIEEDAASLLPEPGVVSGTARERLRGLIGHLVGAMLGREQPLWERVLMARELAEPTPALDALIESIGRPLHEGIGVLVAEITGRDAASAEVALATCSIVAQCLFHLQHRALLHRLHPALAADLGAGRIADHIASFSLAAIGAAA